MNPLDEIQKWYESNCNGDWEHQYGVTIDTLDNPGWTVTIDLVGTPLADVPFARIDEHMESETEWLTCKVEKAQFKAACGPRMLAGALTVFLEWARSPSDEAT